jgi:uncharacterized repeat protein (TIGR03803 family)
MSAPIHGNHDCRRPFLNPSPFLMTSAFRHNLFSLRIFNPNVATPALIVAISFLCSVPTPAAQVTILHSFGDGSVPNDGAYPSGFLIQASNGNLYGTTAGTALNPDGSGMIFEMPLGGAVSAVYTFTGPNLSPSDALLFYKNNLIGTTGTGGITKNGTQYGYGTIFSTTLSGQNTFLYTFQTPRPTSASGPDGSLVLGPDGDLYGTTGAGGTNSRGTAYKIDPTTGTVTVLYSFTSYSASALLLGQDGNFYGITYGATIFKMTPAGVVTNLYTFSGITYGQGPLIQDAAGNFYGATGLNGTYSDGTVFKMTPQFTVTILHSFDGNSDGGDPYTPVIGSDGNLYGTALNQGKDDGGTIYELSTDGSTFSVLHYFSDGTIQNDGWEPIGGLVLGSDNNFYGTTDGGGAMELGTLFELSL